MKSSSQSDPSSQSKKSAEEKSLVKRYYPVFESLILFVLDYQKWWRAFQGFIKNELDYRSGLLVKTLITFVIGSSMLCFSLIWILLGVYFLIQQWTGSSWIAAFSVGGIFFVLGIFFLLLMLKISRLIFDANKEDKLDDEDDWLD